jgi:hypothetical protein
MKRDLLHGGSSLKITLNKKTADLVVIQGRIVSFVGYQVPEDFLLHFYRHSPLIDIGV